MLKFIITGLIAAICTINTVELDIAQAIADAELQNLSIPQAYEYKVPTLNQYGYMFTKFDPIVERFLHSIEKNTKQTFLEIGGAYGNVAETAIEKGIENYYLNDCDDRHLKSFARKLKENGKMDTFKRLHLINGRCPEEVVIKENYFDGILVNKVLHFFTPETIDAFLQWVNKGLKSGGRAFILTASPFFKVASPFSEELLEPYQKKKQDGVRFPGYCSTYKETEPAQKIELQARPASLLFMELETLKHLFLQHGFQIEEEFELSAVDGNNPEWKPGKDMVGIIARKL